MIRSRSLLTICLLGGCVDTLRPVSASLESESSHMRYSMLGDGAMADFGPAFDGKTHADFRNTAHDLVLSVNLSRRLVDPGHRDPQLDVISVAIDTDAGSGAWEIVDRDRSIARYRIGITASRDGADPLVVVQRQGKDGQVFTAVRVADGGWAGEETILPGYSGAMWSNIGSDVDGDGTLELLVPDSRFSGVFGPVGSAPLPPYVYTVQNYRYREASRGGLALYYYRDLLSVTAQDCLDAEDESDRRARQARSANCAAYAALAARAGNWGSARHLLRDLNGEFQVSELPLRMGVKHWDEAVTTQLIEWGYLPRDPTARWWNYKWTDFYGAEQDGGIPFEIQQLIFDWQGCDHFANEPTERPDGSTNEYVVGRIEQYCGQPDGEGKAIPLDQQRERLIRGRYADDPAARYILINLDSYLQTG